MKTINLLLATLSAFLIGACVSAPTGPRVMALPGSGKNFEQFQQDDIECRQYAQSRIGGADANQAVVNAGVTSAAVGTAVGAIAGAAMGGHQGAGVGAGTGLLFGSVAGAGAAQRSANGAQQLYDNAYTQCMYAKGEQVSIPGAQPQLMRRRAQAPVGAYYLPTPPPVPEGTYYAAPLPPPPGNSPPDSAPR